MRPEPQYFDIATLRMKLHSCQQHQYAGGQRIGGAIADLLNQFDVILNALADYQGDFDQIVELPVFLPSPPSQFLGEKEIPTEPPVRLADRLATLNAAAETANVDKPIVTPLAERIDALNEAGK